MSRFQDDESGGPSLFDGAFQNFVGAVDVELCEVLCSQLSAPLGKDVVWLRLRRFSSADEQRYNHDCYCFVEST